jgi:hypothetical protein
MTLNFKYQHHQYRVFVCLIDIKPKGLTALGKTNARNRKSTLDGWQKDQYPLQARW